MVTRSKQLSERPAAAAMVETLEDRRHLSATGSAYLFLGAVVVTGTNNADVIRVSMNADAPAKLDVTVNDRLLGSFDTSRVRNGVHVLARGGDDNVFVDETFGTVTEPVALYGGDGHDMLAGGAHDDLLVGGAGDDLLLAGDGNDLVYGEDGNDTLSGGFGDDLLAGGDDDDALYGDMGNDLLFGGAGSDGLDGGDDDDYLDGGGGADVVLGSPGADWFSRRDDASEIMDLTSGEDVHLA